MAEWPDWNPPPQMIERQPYLPRFMAGGEGNPLGARTLYLGNTLYRIHGTNQPSTIGGFVSSGCIRLTNADVTDLYMRVKIGTRVVVRPAKPATTSAVVSVDSAGASPVASGAPIASEVASKKPTSAETASKLHLTLDAALRGSIPDATHKFGISEGTYLRSAGSLGSRLTRSRALTYPHASKGPSRLAARQSPLSQ